MTTTSSTAGRAMDVESAKKCPICGETAPEPKWLCLPRLMGEAPIGKACSYSIEGDARATQRIQAAANGLVADARVRAALDRIGEGRNA